MNHEIFTFQIHITSFNLAFCAPSPLWRHIMCAFDERTTKTEQERNKKKPSKIQLIYFSFHVHWTIKFSTD